MPSPDWLIERGIGETRAALVEDGRIVEARILRDGGVAAGTVITAQLKSVGRNAVALANGQEFLLPKGAPGVTEGARLNIEVTREALGGSEPKTLAAFMDLVNGWLSARLAGAPVARQMARTAEVWEKVNRAARDVETYNLERKPLVFAVFGLLAEAARTRA